MIKLKSAADIESLAAGGRVLAEVLDRLAKKVAPGVSSWELEEATRQWFKEFGVKPAFLNYAPRGHEPFPAALCVSVNDAVVHGIPKQDEIFNEGDVVGLDLGLIFHNEYYLDAARTVIAGRGSAEALRLVAATKEALRHGIRAARPGNKTGDIGAAVQAYVEEQGFSVVRELVGHGVGFAVHEPPQVPNFGTAGRGEVLRPGLVIAIEPMVTRGDPSIAVGDDGWAVKIASGELAAHFENTVAITENGPRVLTG